MEAMGASPVEVNHPNALMEAMEASPVEVSHPNALMESMEASPVEVSHPNALMEAMGASPVVGLVSNSSAIRVAKTCILLVEAITDAKR